MEQPCDMKICNSAILILLLTFKANGFLDQKEKVTEVKKRHTATLTCLVDFEESAQIYWYFREDETSKERYIYPRDRFKVQTLFRTERQLVIESVREIDQGIYHCKLNNQVLCTFRLVVKSQPRISKLSIALPGPNANPMVGDRVDIICEVQGNPAPEISWKRRLHGKTDLEDIRATGSTLTVHNITKEAAGSYVCVATNELATKQEEITLKVEFEPEVDVYEEIVTGEKSHQTSIMCRVTANPMPDDIWWTKGTSNNPLLTSYLYEIQEDTELLKDYHTVFKVLTFRPGILKGEYYDVYWCRTISQGKEFKRRVEIVRP